MSRELLQLWREIATPIPGDVSFADYRLEIERGRLAAHSGLKPTRNEDAATVAGFLAVWIFVERHFSIGRDWNSTRAVAAANEMDRLAERFAFAAVGCSPRWIRLASSLHREIWRHAIKPPRRGGS